MTKLVNQGGDNSEEILRLEEQIQLLVDEDLTKALQNRKNFRILEDERPSKFFLILENAKRGYNKVMLIKKENIDYNPTLPDSGENTRYTEVTDCQGINEEFHKAFKKSTSNKTLMTVMKLYRISWIVAMTQCYQNISPTVHR